MADAPKWLPRADGQVRRGLEVKNGVIEWAMLREGDPRTKSIFLNNPGLPLHSTNTGVVTAKYGVGGKAGAYPVHVVPQGRGSAKLLAGDSDPAKAAVLEVTVYPVQQVSVAFHNVKATSWTATMPNRKLAAMLDVANALYMYQGNLQLAQVGTVDTVEIPISGDTVDRGGAGGFSTWGNYVSSKAVLNVFFVKDYQNSASSGTTWAGVHKNWMVIEPNIPEDMIGMVFGHEVDHFFGLKHPAPALDFNLMNQSSVGDRRRYKSYLTRTQIETVTDRCKWGDHDYAVCTVVRETEKAIKPIFEWLESLFR